MRSDHLAKHVKRHAKDRPALAQKLGVLPAVLRTLQPAQPSGGTPFSTQPASGTPLTVQPASATSLNAPLGGATAREFAR